MFAVFLVLERILSSSCRQEVVAVATYSGNTTETRERLVTRVGQSNHHLTLLASDYHYIFKRAGFHVYAAK